MRRRVGASLLAGLLVAVAVPVGIPPVGIPPVGIAPAGAAPGPSSAPEYWFDTWHVQSLWDSGTRGQGVTIAEIDTGVNARLPELTGRILPGKDFGQAGNGQVDREINPFGHGTAMASIMVARPGLLNITGLAPDAKILPIAVPLDGTTDAGRPDQLPRAIGWAVDHGAKVVSLSVGGKRTPTGDDTPCPADEQQAVYRAMRKGAIVVAAVGNTGPRRNTVEEPGACLGVVSVGAVDASGTVANFSARQPYLSLVAPGVGIPSLGRVPGQAYSGDGTSQATALVSAAIALEWSRYPNLSGSAVVARLLATLDARRRTPSQDYGYGVLDAYRAVTARVPTGAPNPIYAAALPFRRRADAFARPVATPSAPAVKPPLVGGRFTVGRTTRITGQVRAGVAAAVVGLVALMVLIVAGRRRRRSAVAVPAATDGPVSDGPVSDGPVSDGPVSDGPVSDGPAGVGPVSDGPGFTGIPTGAPAVEYSSPPAGMGEDRPRPRPGP